MYTLTLKMRALLVLLLFAMLMSLVTMPVPSFAQNTNYQEYLAYKEALGSPASLWIDPLAIDLPNGEKLVVYCYNKELDYPGAIELGGTPGYMHDHYPKIKADIQSKINNILYNGYPTNANGYNVGLTDEQFRGITQYAVWHYTDNLTEDAVRIIVQSTYTGEVVNTIMTAFNKLIGKDHPAPNDFVVDFFMPQDPGYQNLVGAKQTNLPDPGDRTVVTFSKVDANTNALLQNAKLRVAEENGPMSFDYTTGDSNKRMYLLRNKEYVLSELNAPDGYEIASPISFRITGDGNVEVGSNGSWALVGDGTVVMRDVPLAVVTVTFSKTAVNGTEELRGASLKVVKGENEDGALVEEWISTGVQKKIKLEVGTYTMVETTAPVGYEIAESITFRITSAGTVEIKDGDNWLPQKEVQVHMEDALSPMPEPLTADVTFSKTAVNGTEELRGASLKVVKGENEDGALVEEWTSTGEQKKIKLEVGSYTMVETTAPAGYEIAESITFRITDKGRVEIKDSNNWIQQRDAQIHMKDAPTPTPETPEPKTTEVIFSKTAVNGTEELPGAELKITRNADKKLVSSWISSSLPKAFTLERDVEYTMTEIQAPKGYELAESIIFRITKEGKVEIKERDAWVAQKEAKVKMEDALSDEPKPESKTLEVHFSKVEVNGTKELPGAELKITRNGDKKLIASWISSSTAKSFTLERGVEYTMREIQAPKGYAIAENIVFRITDDGKVEIYEGKTWVAQKDAKVVMEDALLKTLPGTGQKGGYLFVLAIAVLLLAIILLRREKRSKKSM